MFIMPQLEFSSIIEETKPVQEPKVEQMDLGIKEEPTFRFLTVGPSELLRMTPTNAITFSDGSKTCGSFSWKDGLFKFEGDAETSAKLFVNYVSQYIGVKIPS
jgi:hypothetical protein